MTQMAVAFHPPDTDIEIDVSDTQTMSLNAGLRTVASTLSMREGRGYRLNGRGERQPLPMRELAVTP